MRGLCFGGGPGFCSCGTYAVVGSWIDELRLEVSGVPVVLTRDGSLGFESLAIDGVAATFKWRVHEDTASESGFKICIK